MNELMIREEKQDLMTILHLEGTLNKKNLARLESALKPFLHASTPEFILLECSHLTSLEKECLPLLQNTAAFLSDQARELSICCTPTTFEVAQLAPPLLYYKTQEDAIRAFHASASEDLDKGALPKKVLHLNILSGPCKGSLSLKEGDKEITIGRHSKCNLSIPHDIKASRFHCKIYEKNGLFVLEDLQSSNGTFFEEKMITMPVEIKHQSRFQVGETNLEATIVEEKESFSLPVASSMLEEMPDLPSLEPATKEEGEEPGALEAPMLAGLEIGGMETVIGISLSDLIGDALKTTKLVEVAPPLKIPDPEVFGVASPKKEEKAKVLLDAESWAVLQSSLPTLLKRRLVKLPAGPIAGRYEVVKKIGETNTSLVLQASMGKEDKIMLQYTKEPMVMANLSAVHPHLLIPDSQGEFEERIYRAFHNQDQPAMKLPLPEVKLLEISILLADVLQTLHEKGFSGFDFTASSIVYQSNGLASFSLIPAVIYEDLLGEEADAYSYGTLLFFLATGKPLPYTTIGTLDKEEMEKLGERVSPELWLLILEILKRTENHLEKIAKKLTAILHSRLMPELAEKKAVVLEILNVDHALVYTLDGSSSYQIPWQQPLAQKLREEMLSGKEETFLQAAQTFYKIFYPSKLKEAMMKLKQRHLRLSLGSNLHALPWELANTGTEFLNQRFFFSRSFYPLPLHTFTGEKCCSPQILILSSAEKTQESIQEGLKDRLHQQFPTLKIKTANVLENSYALLPKIAQSDIVHMMLPFHYDEASPFDSGWVLEEKKLLKLRFLEHSQRKPKVLFQHTCGEQGDNTLSFLAAIYQSEISFVLGNLWPMDTEEPAFQFYQNLLHGSSFGQALSSPCQPPLSYTFVLYGEGEKGLGIPLPK